MKTHHHTIAALMIALAGLAGYASPAAGGAGAQVNPTDEGFLNMAQDTLAKAQTLLDSVLAVDGERTVDNTLEPYNEMLLLVANLAEQSSLQRNVHPDEAVRKAAEEVEQKTSAFATEVSLNRAVYDAINAVDVSQADPVTQYAIQKMLRDFRRAGVDKSDEVRAQIKRLNEELVKISQEFGANIRKDVRSITLDSPEELDGLPADYVKAHPPGDDGKIRITTDYPDSVPFMQYAKSNDARQRMFMEFRNRGYPANQPVLARLLKTRWELAQILGYPHWADYITEDKMIGSAARAAEFIDKISEIAAKRSEADYQMLLERKQKDFPEATRVENWEASYYETQVKTEHFDFDPQSVRPYFEFNRVRQGLFDLTRRMFGIEYRKVEDVTPWHPDVTVWDVYEGDKKLGRFYLDLFPRENKYKHAACFGVLPGLKGKQLPESALVCNFPDPRKTDGPALMDYKEVETFFHEFGHLLHAIFAGHQPWTNISGINTEWDFVEAPSQMLEEWLANHEVLSLFARHHETNQPIPAEMVANLKRAEDFGKGVWVRNQMFYAAMSLNYYNRDPASFDTTALQAELMTKYSPFAFVDGTHLEYSFGHLDGYSAIYYTYMWSLTIAKDLFSRFEKEGLLNEQVARAYRREVLAPGGGKPAAELVRGFLGRDFDLSAYQAWLSDGTAD